MNYYFFKINMWIIANVSSVSYAGENKRIDRMNFTVSVSVTWTWCSRAVMVSQLFAMYKCNRKISVLQMRFIHYNQEAVLY